MGFPNKGVQALVRNLESYKKRKVPLFINVGKNRWTENEKAHKDYMSCIQKTHQYADAFVINLSSPNTKGLRDLLSKEFFENFLFHVTQVVDSECKGKPLLLKLSPDMAADDLKMVLDVSAPSVDGWILTNTTKNRYEGHPFAENEGGVSGSPLTELSRSLLSTTVEHLGSQKSEKLIISAGGIMGPDEIKIRLQMGANLVQFYSSLVFHGPAFFKNSLKALRTLKP